MKKHLRLFSLIIACFAIFQTQAVNYAAYLPGVATGATSNTVSYIQIPDLPITSLPFTMEMMVKPEVLNSYGGFWTDRTSTVATNLQYGSNVAYLRLDYGNVTDHATVPDKGYAVPLINQWNHIALVVTATEIKIYLNGTLYKKSAMTNTALPSNGVTYIGWDNAATTFNRTIKGQFDEIRFWNYERSAADLAANKTTTLTGTESGLIAYYNFDNQNANDLTTNALNATAASGVTYVANTFAPYVPVIADWKAPLIGANVTGLNTYPSQYGWRCNSNTGLWSQLNVASNVRYQDNITTFTYNGSAWSGRAMYIRWDGTPAMNSIYTYPVYLDANKVYSFTGKVGWNSTGGTSTYSDFIFGINTSQNGNGTEINSKTTRVLVADKSKLFDVSMNFATTTAGVYYLTLKNATDNTGVLGILTDLAIVENTVVDKTNLGTLISSATTLNSSPQPVGTSNAYTLLAAAITNAQTVFGNSAATALDVTSQESSLQAAIANVNSAILIYTRKSAWTTLPVDVTSIMVNPSFESTIDYAYGWTNVGGFAKATSTALPNKNGTNFVEKYVAPPGVLTNLKLYQKINSIPNGVYLLTVNAQAIQQSNTTYPGGAFIYANNTKTEVFIAKDYTVTVTVTDNTLEVGFEVLSSGNWMALDNFRLSYISDGTPYVVLSPSTLFFDANSLTKTFNVSGGNLTSDVVLTAPAGIALDKPNLTIAQVQAGTTVTALFDNSTAISNGTISATSGTLTQNITVNTSADVSCFTPLYSTLTNLIPNPIMNDISAFGGWGLKSVVLGEAYCGAGCVKFNATTNIYPTGAALDVPTVAWAPNSTYRLHARVKAVDGTFAFFAKGTAPDVTISVPQNNQWVLIDQTFTTGAAPTSNFFSFNNVDGASTGKIAYIDNYELYNITSTITGVNQLGNTKFNTYVADSKIVADFNLDQASAVEFSVYNTQGMLISTQKGNFVSGANHTVINANLTTGVYIVKIAQDGKFFTQKVIK
jgi:hypothetical protein